PPYVSCFRAGVTSWLGQIETSETYQWYEQPHIGMGNAFLEELKCSNGFIARNPKLYSCVEAEMRRANLNRFPYSLFYGGRGYMIMKDLTPRPPHCLYELPAGC
ncbi:MAG: hypothetical protein R8K20_00775, partial [Gallionellaceae bacterium]